jgi:hypothetical protein
VVGATLFLASDEADWIPGAVLPVDGELTAGNMQMMKEMIKDQASRRRNAGSLIAGPRYIVCRA